MKKIKLQIFRKPEQIENLPFECSICGEVLPSWKRQHQGNKPFCFDCYILGNPRNSWRDDIRFADQKALSNISAAIKILENACVK